ncbi:MAG: hypothetical protein ABIT10_02835 [Alteraurantiacibacter sp.]
MAAAQDAVAEPPPAEVALSTDAAPTLAIPRLTPIVIEVLATLSSETSTSGDRFPLRLVEPIVVDGVTGVPAGTAGEGEVIHAKRKGGMGAAGELIVTARFLQVGDQQIPLRSMRVGGGDPTSRIDTVNNLAVASTATLPLVALVGFFIEGGALTIAEGARASARIAQDISVPLPAAAPAVESTEHQDDPPALTAAAEVDEQQGSIVEGETE